MKNCPKLLGAPDLILKILYCGPQSIFEKLGLFTDLLFDYFSAPSVIPVDAHFALETCILYAELAAFDVTRCSLPLKSAPFLLAFVLLISSRFILLSS